MLNTLRKILTKYPIGELTKIAITDPLLCWSYLRRSLKVPYLPSRMIIDPANICTLRCPFCYTGNREHGATKMKMSYELFEHIVNLNPRVRYIDVYNWGEPLLNHDIFRMMELCRHKNIFTSVHTSMTAHSTEVLEHLLQSPPSRLHLSVDGVRQETYEHYRVGGDFSRVKRNMEYLSQRLRHARIPLQVEWQFLYHKFNERDIPEAKVMAQKLGFILRLRPLLVPKSQIDIWHSPIKDAEKSYLTKIRVPCPHLWLRMTVSAQGHLTFCCSAYHDADHIEVPLSKVSTPQEFLSLWNSTIFRRARDCFNLRTTFCDIDNPILCEVCGYFNRTGGLDPAKYPIIEDHLSTARKEIIEKKEGNKRKVDQKKA